MTLLGISRIRGENKPLKVECWTGRVLWDFILCLGSAGQNDFLRKVWLRQDTFLEMLKSGLPRTWATYRFFCLPLVCLHLQLKLIHQVLKTDKILSVFLSLHHKTEREFGICLVRLENCQLWLYIFLSLNWVFISFSIQTMVVVFWNSSVERNSCVLFYFFNGPQVM